MAITESNDMVLGTDAPDFSLPGVDGKAYSLASFEDAKALLVVFTCNHCPVAEAYEDRLVALQADYLEKGMRLCAINPNDDSRYPGDSFEAMKTRAREKHFNFPYLRDESQEVARAYRAACTPDIYLFGASKTLAYHGRIDDNWNDESKVTSRDLRRALDAILHGDPINFDVRPATGCSIKWRV